MFGLVSDLNDAIEERELEPLENAVEKVDKHKMRDRMPEKVEEAEDIIEQLKVKKERHLTRKKDRE